MMNLFKEASQFNLAAHLQEQETKNVVEFSAKSFEEFKKIAINHSNDCVVEIFTRPVIETNTGRRSVINEMLLIDTKRRKKAAVAAFYEGYFDDKGKQMVIEEGYEFDKEYRNFKNDCILTALNRASNLMLADNNLVVFYYTPETQCFDFRKEKDAEIISKLRKKIIAKGAKPFVIPK